MPENLCCLPMRDNRDPVFREKWQAEDSDGKKTDFYLGVRNNEENEAIKRSTVTLGDTLRSTLIGHFPGAKLHHEDRKKIVSLSDQILHQKNVVSVSVVGSNKIQDMQTNEKFVQGLEKLALAMQGRKYMGIILAENQSPQNGKRFSAD